MADPKSKPALVLAERVREGRGGQLSRCRGGEESLSTCEMAHWAAAMAVLATEAALMRLPSLEAMSLGRMSDTGSEMGAPPAGGQAGKGHRGDPDLLEPFANSTLMVLPSMVSGGCRACRIWSS